MAPEESKKRHDFSVSRRAKFLLEEVYDLLLMNQMTQKLSLGIVSFQHYFNSFHALKD